MVQKAVERERGIGLEGAILYCVPLLQARVRLAVPVAPMTNGHNLDPKWDICVVIGI